MGIVMEKRENFSRKRTAILNVLQDTNVHPTADWVYARLKPRYPNLSLGTVYRNLRKFCETGKASSIGVIAGQEHFDGRTDPHAHFICSKCGSVLDIPQDFLDEEKMKAVFQTAGCSVESASVVFHGVCRDCAAKGQDAAPKKDVS